MTKSQNTKNEQQNDLCITSEQLTEQFLDDEIDESKLYYFKQKMSEEIEVGRPFALNMVRAMDDTYLDWFLIDSVLAPVPTYEEWQAKLEENKQLKKWCEEFNTLNVSEENKRLKSEYKAECKRADELEDSYWKSEKENQKLKEEVSRESYKVSEAYCLVEELKELLKEVNDYLPEFEIPMSILAKIDEVLK